MKRLLVLRRTLQTSDIACCLVAVHLSRPRLPIHSLSKRCDAVLSIEDTKAMIDDAIAQAQDPNEHDCCVTGMASVTK